MCREITVTAGGGNGGLGAELEHFGQAATEGKLTENIRKTYRRLTEILLKSYRKLTEDFCKTYVELIED